MDPLKVRIGIALLLVGLACLLLYPGYFPYDSLIQLKDAKSHYFADFQPPVLTWVIGNFNHLIPGSGALFLFSGLLFYLGITFAFHPLFANRRWILGSIVFFLFAPLLLGLACVDKNSILMSGLCFSTGMFTLAEREKSRLGLGCGIFGLYWAAMSRHNSIFAVFPFCVWLAIIFRDWYPPSNWKFPLKSRISVALSALAVCCGIFSSLAIFTRMLMHPRSQHPSQMVMIFDLGGISVESGRYYFPRFMDRRNSPPLGVQDLVPLYRPDFDQPLYLGDNPRKPGMTRNDQEYRELTRTWLTAIYQEPLAYLKHRARVFWSFLWGDLRLPTSEGFIPFPRFSALESEPSWASAQRRRIFYTFPSANGNPLFFPITYLVTHLLLLLLLKTKKLK